MTRHLAAPDRPVLCCKSSQDQQVPLAIRALNQTTFHHNLLAPDLIRGSLGHASLSTAIWKGQIPLQQIIVIIQIFLSLAQGVDPWRNRVH